MGKDVIIWEQLRKVLPRFPLNVSLIVEWSHKDFSQRHSCPLDVKGESNILGRLDQDYAELLTSSWEIYDREEN